MGLYEERMMVLDMLKAGKIGVDEADGLLEALDYSHAKEEWVEGDFTAETARIEVVAELFGKALRQSAGSPVKLAAGH